MPDEKKENAKATEKVTDAEKKLISEKKALEKAVDKLEETVKTGQKIEAVMQNTINDQRAEINKLVKELAEANAVEKEMAAAVVYPKMVYKKDQKWNGKDAMDLEYLICENAEQWETIKKNYQTSVPGK